MPNYIYKFPRPAVTVDIVVFSIQLNKLEILLIQRAKEPYRGKWALPGGFVGIEESLHSAAERELEEETGLINLHLEQLYTFGTPRRDPRGRIITVSYYSIFNQGTNNKTTGASDATQASWFPIVNLPPLAFDHDEIVSCGLNKIRNDFANVIINFNLLPEVFTLKMLQNYYEIIHDVKFEKQKFIQFIFVADILELASTKIDSINYEDQLYKFK